MPHRTGMNLNTALFFMVAILLNVSQAMAATPQESASDCARKKGSAKTCCSVMLEDQDEINNCIQQTLDLRYAESSPPSAPDNPAARNSTPNIQSASNNSDDQSDSLGLAGSWTSEFGDTMQIDTVSPWFKARFNLKKGRIVGEMRNSTLDGYWIQGDESSRGRCNEHRDGSNDWGRISLSFSANSYSGKWGYCNGKLLYKLSGTRISKSEPSLPPKRAVPPYRIGNGFKPHDLSHLPVGKWEPWYVSIHDNSYNQKDYGLKAQEVRRFEKKMSDIASLIKKAETLNPVRGCNPSMSGYIDGVYDRSDPYSKQQPLRSSIMVGCFKLYEEKRKKNGKETTVWEPDRETDYYHVTVNHLPEIYVGSMQTLTDGPSSIRPFDQYFTEPLQVGEFQGFPIYATLHPNGELTRQFVLIARKGVKPFLPVNREHATKALFKRIDNTITSRQRGVPAKGELEKRERMKQQLAALTPQEKLEQACYLYKHSDPGWGTGEFEGAVAMGTKGCEPIVRLNPELFDPKVSRSAIQLLIISRFKDMQEKYGALKPERRDVLSEYRVTLDTMIQTDWNEVYQMIDKP